MANDFSLSLKDFGEKTIKRINRAQRKIAMDLLRGVTMKTPVDTGRARGNWQVGVGYMPLSSLLTEDKSGGPTVRAGNREIGRLKEGSEESIFIVNNLVYIIPLEHGHSQQAPAGMVGVTIAEYPGIVRLAAETEGNA